MAKDPAHSPISTAHLDAFRESQGEDQAALDVLYRDNRRWLYRHPLGLTSSQLEDVASDSLTDVYGLLADPEVAIDRVNQRLQTRLGCRRKSERRRTRLLEPEGATLLIDPETPLDLVLRRESASRLFKAVRMARGLLGGTIDACGQPHGSHLVEHFGLQELGLVRADTVEPLAAKKPAARRQALRRALGRFAESLDRILSEAQSDRQLDQELVEWTRRFLKGEIDDVDPFAVLVEIQELLDEAKLGSA